jgi:hypothetical protein
MWFRPPHERRARREGQAVAWEVSAARARDNRWIGVVLPLALTAAILLLDAAESSGRTQYVGLLVSVPLLAAALVGPRRTALCGVAALVSAYAFGFTQQDATNGLLPSSAQGTRLGFIAAACVAAVLSPGSGSSVRRAYDA